MSGRDDRRYDSSWRDSSSSSMSRSKSFSIERRNGHRNDRFSRRGPPRSRGHDRHNVIDLPTRQKPAVLVKLDISFTPSADKKTQKEFLDSNEINIKSSKEFDIALTFEELGLPKEILDTCKEKEWDKPTLIQSVAIPSALKGCDLVGIAKTGSGKTAAFLIPIITHILRQDEMCRDDGPIALIMAPTRELAQQIEGVCISFAKKFNIRTCCCFGGEPVDEQRRKLRNAPAVVIGCPGRLMQFMDEGDLKFERISFLVLDEADRMLDMGFSYQIRHIVESKDFPKERQTMMFSATWPKEIRELAHDFLVSPVEMKIGNQDMTVNSNIKQIVERVEEHQKFSKTMEKLEEYKGKKIIIFVKTKRTVDDITDNLKRKGFVAYGIHGDKPQKARDTVLNHYKSRSDGVLIATDVVSRGLDIDDIGLVINYDLPQDFENYVHRIGRTCRGKCTEGYAYSMFTNEDKNVSKELFKFMKKANQEIPDWLSEMADSLPRGAYKNRRSAAGYGGYDRGRNFGNRGYFNGGRDRDSGYRRRY